MLVWTIYILNRITHKHMHIYIYITFIYLQDLPKATAINQAVHHEKIARQEAACRVLTSLKQAPPPWKKIMSLSEAPGITWCPKVGKTGFLLPGK